jgi:3-deoxy-D-manno-octulosonate 8-phosphate phosphatase (KDO 8-P phosphatase)
LKGSDRYTFWHMDGFGDLSLNMNGVRPVYLDTSSIDDEGLYRAKELKLDKNYFKVTNRWAKIEELKKEMGIGDENVGFIGCEITDLEAS